MGSVFDISSFGSRGKLWVVYGLVVTTAFLLVLSLTDRSPVAQVPTLPTPTTTAPDPYQKNLLTYMLRRPIRLLDTRPGESALVNRGAPIAPGVFVLQVAGVEYDGQQIPTDAVAVIGNVTVVGASGPGWLRAYPADEPTPHVSTINYVAGQTIANGMTVRLSLTGATGRMAIRVDESATHVIFDVTGYLR